MTTGPVSYNVHNQVYIFQLFSQSVILSHWSVLTVYGFSIFTIKVSYVCPKKRREGISGEGKGSGEGKRNPLKKIPVLHLSFGSYSDRKVDENVREMLSFKFQGY